MPKKKTTSSAKTAVRRRAKRIVDAFELRSVVLVESHWKRGNLREEGLPAKTECTAKLHSSLVEEEHKIQVHATLGVTSQYEETPDEPVVSLVASYLIEYVSAKPIKVSKEDLDAFAPATATFNVWPYFREFVQSATCRMGLPPLTLPFFRMSQQTVAKPETPPQTKPKKKRRATKKR
jgi:hypothetical protein